MRTSGWIKDGPQNTPIQTLRLRPRMHTQRMSTDAPHPRSHPSTHSQPTPARAAPCTAGCAAYAAVAASLVTRAVDAMGHHASSFMATRWHADQAASAATWWARCTARCSHTSETVELLRGVVVQDDGG